MYQPSAREWTLESLSSWMILHHSMQRCATEGSPQCKRMERKRRQGGGSAAQRTSGTRRVEDLGTQPTMEGGLATAACSCGLQVRLSATSNLQHTQGVERESSDGEGGAVRGTKAERSNGVGVRGAAPAPLVLLGPIPSAAYHRARNRAAPPPSPPEPSPATRLAAVLGLPVTSAVLVSDVLFRSKAGPVSVEACSQGVV